MTVPSLAGGADALVVQAASALAKERERAIAVLRRITRQQKADGQALVSLIERAGGAPEKGQHLDVYV